MSKAKRQRILNEKGEEIAEMGVQIPGWQAQVCKLLDSRGRVSLHKGCKRGILGGGVYYIRF